MVMGNSFRIMHISNVMNSLWAVDFEVTEASCSKVSVHSTKSNAVFPLEKQAFCIMPFIKMQIHKVNKEPGT